MSAASDNDFRAGDRLGEYELVREIGRGGFASVWLARRQGPGGFEARFAVKLIRMELSTDPSFQTMLIDEAKLAAAISHPNVVSIFELCQDGDLLYLVMEYVNGRPLSILRNMMMRRAKPIPPGIVMRIIGDTCAGLHAAHELERDGRPLGVIHRDVSPQNILVSDKGAVKLIDFGVAKANDRLSADTTDGHTKGKLRYMAPEQALARPVDRRADLWSTGAVAFDLLMGHPPYDGNNDLVRLFRLMDASPPPTLGEHVPAPIAHVIRKALESNPSARWATAAEMRGATEAALDICGIRVTSDDVLAFFGEALAPLRDDASDADDRTGGALLRERLQRPSAGAPTTTVDVPRREGPGLLDDRVETLGALDTSPRGVPRRRSRLLMVVSGGALCAVALLALALGRTSHEVVSPTEPSAAATFADAGDRKPAIPEPDPPGAIPAPSLASADASPAVTELPGALEWSAPQGRPLGRPRTTRPRVSKPPAPVATPSSRPRYDDTIQ